MKSNSKYFYSKEEDKVIVDFVTNDFKQKQEERRPYELIWELNMNFYVGNQYSYIMPSGNLSEIEKNYIWENREVYNHIAPIIESRLSKLNKVKPQVEVKPSSNTDADTYSAKLAKAILSSNFKENNISSLVNTATHWSEITGTSFYKVSWDTNQLSTNEVASKNGGDVKISVCSPFEIYPDSNFSESLEDCSSIIETRAYPAAEINSVWGVNLAGEDVDLFELSNSTSNSNFSGRSNYTKVLHSKKHDYLLLIERYEKPTKRHPNGKLTIVCKDKLLYDGDLPYVNSKSNVRTYPFIKQVSIKQLSCFWGMSVIERCIPLQRAYNSLKNRKHEFLSRLTSGVLTVEDGSVDIDNLEINGIEPGKIIVYRNGSTPPKFLDPGTIPEDFEKEETKLLNELNNLSCISEISTNTTLPAGINSGTAISLLVEEDESRLSFTAEHLRTSLTQIAKQALYLYKQFASTIRLNKLADNNGMLELFYWTNNDISCDNITIDCENELDNTNSHKKELLIKLLEKGIFQDKNGTISHDTKEKILSELGFNNWCTFDDLEELHRKKASKENLTLTNLEDPLEIDEHQIHINEHTKFIIADNENTDKEYLDKLICHINKHKQYLKEDK
ncbi:MAG: hypothetical protein E7341_01330 [Clostridiales bacterium]|nr:hypothetical protein [Clostridiales bacterium]